VNLSIRFGASSRIEPFYSVQLIFKSRRLGMTVIPAAQPTRTIVPSDCVQETLVTSLAGGAAALPQT
jgi:hypothetical protein